MAGADIPTSNVFDNLPDVLIDDIIMQCSPIDRTRAAAACRALWRVYDEFTNQLTYQSITFNGRMDWDVQLCAHNIGKLVINLKDGIGDCSDSANVYAGILSFVERMRKDGVLHLSNVYELGIDVGIFAYDTLTQPELCTQLLLQLLPNLTSMCFVYGALRDYAYSSLRPAPGIRRLGLVLEKDFEPLHYNLALFPSLNTLCLKVHGPLPASWSLWLSQPPQLRSLSLNLMEEQSNLSGLLDLTTLRHLKLETNSTINMRRISRLQHLESLCLCGVQVSYPEALAKLQVTSLTLQSVRLSQPYNQDLDCNAQKGQPAWGQLTRVNLSGTVSEQLLQAMLLPHPADRSISVKVSFETFDQFDVFDHLKNEHPFNMSLKQRHREVHQRSDDKCIHYIADTTPTLGPAYLAAARPSSVTLNHHFGLEAYEALQQLLLLDPIVCRNRWHELLLSVPVLTSVMFRLWGVTTTRITTAHTTQRSGITRDQPVNHSYHFHARKFTGSIYSSEEVISHCIYQVLLKLLAIPSICLFLYWLMTNMLSA